MDSFKITEHCMSCGGTAFRTDRPYGNFCSMMCALRGVLTPAGEKEEAERFKRLFKNNKSTEPTERKN